MGKDLVALANKLAEPLAASLGLDIWGVELVGGGRPVLRLFVERKAPEGACPSSVSEECPPDTVPAGVSVDECAELSRLLGLSLEVEDSFDSAWVLEVSSPGLERVFFRLEQLEPFIGKELDVTLDGPHPSWPAADGVPGRRKFRGTLLGIGDDSFTLGIPAENRLPDEPETVVILWADVRRAHLVHVFPEPGLPGKGGKATKKGPQRRR